MVSNAEMKQQLDSFAARMEGAMKALTDANEKNKSELISKMDTITDRLNGYDAKMDKIDRAIQDTDTRVGNLTAHIQNGDVNVAQKFTVLNKRIADLEEKLAALQTIPNKIVTLEKLPERIDHLAENIEDRTNRQLRETLVFKNIPEMEQDPSYKETKQLLAKVISDTCPDISYQAALSQIKRAHRESNRKFDNNTVNSRAGTFDLT